MSTKISSTIKHENLAASLGLKNDDVLVIFSDINRLAKHFRTRGGFDVNEFINSFQKTLNKGTILIPSFTDNLKDGDTFDYLKSKPTTGALAKRTFKRKDFIRTNDPLHSFLIWGKHQKELLSLDSESTFGNGSVFEYIHEKNAKILMIDVNFQNSFTFIHYIEEVLNIWYRKPYCIDLNYIDRKGVTKTKTSVFYTKRKGVETDLFDFEKKVKLNKVSKDYIYNDSSLCLVESIKIFEFTKQYLSMKGKLYKIAPKKYLKQLVKKALGYKNPID
ncbi:AAC(3) family N-acetyltransferase [Crocinitomicaceae bacterium]|nr:AAC(3) family N-acetyltransferase [Crocinitomicaceae bacterium]